MVQDGKQGLGEGQESADDTGQIALVFWREVLDGGNVGRPESGEGDEDCETVGVNGREVVHVVSIIFPAIVMAADRRWLGLGA